jgi:hypothetical protein
VFLRASDRMIVVRHICGRPGKNCPLLRLCHSCAGRNPDTVGARIVPDSRAHPRFARWLDPCLRSAAFGRNQNCLLKKQDVAPLQCRGDRPAPWKARKAIPARAFMLLEALGRARTFAPRSMARAVRRACPRLERGSRVPARLLSAGEPRSSGEFSLAGSPTTCRHARVGSRPEFILPCVGAEPIMGRSQVRPGGRRV